MPRPSSKPRVPELDPDTEAIAFSRRVLEHLADAVGALLGPTRKLERRAVDNDLRKTRLYSLVHALASYAVHGTALARPVSELLDDLSPLATALLWPRVDLEAILANIDPNHEADAIKLLLAAAVAREQIERGRQAVSAAQLAVLAGLSRRHIGQLVRDGTLETETEGKRGTGGSYFVRAGVARRWLASRDISGFARNTQDNN